MRIIAGKYRGKVLTEFKLGSTRPTADMVREALFDKIGISTSNSVFLDLFAGTGAVGIEALSRGAKDVFFVDESQDAIKIIKQNLLSIKVQYQNVLNVGFDNALKNFANNDIKFDIIFLDPPYKTDYAEIAVSLIKYYNLLNKGGTIVWEHDEIKNVYIENNFPNSKTKKYGKKFLTYINL